MPLPTPLSRRKKAVHKNTFGHVLILAGSRRMLGAAALTSLAAMRCGAGLVTVGIPESLNSVIQKKISNVVMTLPLDETKEQSLSLKAYSLIQKIFERFDAIAIGPGLSTHKSTIGLIQKIIQHSPKPLICDADALTAIALMPSILKRTPVEKILTPHPGEMSRLTGQKKRYIENHRSQCAQQFSQKYKCVLLLKGHHTIVSPVKGRVYINKTGNAGMATAGSGDVLTGMVASFLGQGLKGFEAARWGAYLHGKAGDLASRSKTKVSMTSEDIIEQIPKAIQSCK